MRAYKIRLEFVWGHQSRIIGLSKTNPSYYYPPPTTIIGAVAEPLAKNHRLGENPATVALLQRALSHDLLALGVKPVNAFPLKYMDINRIVAVGDKKRKKYPSPEDLVGSFDAPARGKTIMSPLRPGEPPMIDVLLVFSKPLIRVKGIDIRISAESLWEIHRLGSKESIVSVVDVDATDKVSLEQGLAITSYSFPLTASVSVVEKLGGRWTYEVYVNPYSLGSSEPLLHQYFSGKNLLTYMIPLRTSSSEDPMIKLRVREPNTIYSVEFSGATEKIVGVHPASAHH